MRQLSSSRNLWPSWLNRTVCYFPLTSVWAPWCSVEKYLFSVFYVKYWCRQICLISFHRKIWIQKWGRGGVERWNSRDRMCRDSGQKDQGPGEKEKGVVLRKLVTIFTCLYLYSRFVLLSIGVLGWTVIQWLFTLFTLTTDCTRTILFWDFMYDTIPKLVWSPKNSFRHRV